MQSCTTDCTPARTSKPSSSPSSCACKRSHFSNGSVDGLWVQAVYTARGRDSWGGEHRRRDDGSNMIVGLADALAPSPAFLIDGEPNLQRVGVDIATRHDDGCDTNRRAAGRRGWR